MKCVAYAAKCALDHFTVNQTKVQEQRQKHLIVKLTGLRESSSNGTAKELVQSTTPLETIPNKTPTTRFLVPRATRW